MQLISKAINGAHLNSGSFTVVLCIRIKILVIRCCACLQFSVMLNIIVFPKAQASSELDGFI